MNDIYLYIRQGEQIDSAQTLQYAAAAYAGETGQELPEPLHILRKGKPIFVNAANIHFSVTHSGEYWLAAFAPFPLGIDIQQHRPCDTNRISRRFHPQERAWLAIHGREEDFFRLWTAKESYVKLRGSGIDHNFGHFSVIGEDGESISAADVIFAELVFGTGYSFCFCCNKKAAFSGVVKKSCFDETNNGFEPAVLW